VGQGKGRRRLPFSISASNASKPVQIEFSARQVPTVDRTRAQGQELRCQGLALSAARIVAISHNAAMKLPVAHLLALSILAVPALASAQESARPVYRCPGTPVLYTDTLNPQEAKTKGCALLEGAPITVIASPRPRASAQASAQASAPRPAEAKVDPAEQRARDSDARRILEAELRRAETDLATMRKEYNNGEPERLGSERNFQRYLDRVADMKAAIGRKESDIAAIKRELAKLPQ
jgi:hypothetical protein